MFASNASAYGGGAAGLASGCSSHFGTAPRPNASAMGMLPKRVYSTTVKTTGKVGVKQKARTILFSDQTYN